ncbi:MAG: YceI family protein [Leadbetterella sp.]
MKSTFFSLLFALVSSGIFAQNWQPTTFSIKFKIKNMGFNVNGSLNGLKAQIGTSPTGEINSISATVETKTIDTDNSLRDKHLRDKSDFFECEKFPTITLKSTQLIKNADNSYSGVFNLTIKGVTKSIKIPITFTENNTIGNLSSSFTINRQDWKFGGDSMGLSDKIDIKLQLNLKK